MPYHSAERGGGVDAETGCLFKKVIQPSSTDQYWLTTRPAGTPPPEGNWGQGGRMGLRGRPNFSMALTR